jgi:glycosyltransferase involved in cell wall biosynthesis
MRIGIVPTLTASSGGLYQYNLRLLRTLRDCCQDDEFVIFMGTGNLPPELAQDPPRWTTKPITPPVKTTVDRPLDSLRRMVGEGPHREAWRKFRRLLHRRKTHTQASDGGMDPDYIWWQPAMTQWFQQCDIDLMIYPNPLPLSFEAKIPFIMSIHDLQHRLQPEFPEVSADGEWEGREYLFRNAARYAKLLIADSETGKEDILNFYGPFGITEDRVKVLPFLPAVDLNFELDEDQQKAILEGYGVPDNYLFYPAQFWPHKNHARIVRALDLLNREYNFSIPIVFCGSNSDKIRQQTFQEVNQLANQFGLEQQIHYLGYVPDEHISALYARARALIMPTFFGPTNIPILEAWAFGCPVLTSDIRGIREQVADAAVMVDPRSVNSIAEGMYRICTDDELASELVAKGRTRLNAYTPSDYQQRLIQIIEEFEMRSRDNAPRAKGEG